MMKQRFFAAEERDVIQSEKRQLDDIKEELTRCVSLLPVSSPRTSYLAASFPHPVLLFPPPPCSLPIPLTLFPFPFSPRPIPLLLCLPLSSLPSPCSLPIPLSPFPLSPLFVPRVCSLNSLVQSLCMYRKGNY